MALFTGSGVAIVTPFNEDFTVNHKKLSKLIEWHIEKGTDAIIICGTTGEASTMNDAEHLACIRTAVDTVAGRLPVIAGTGSNDTDHGIYLSVEAEKLGADALLQVTPYYNKTSQEGLIAHYGAIARRVNIPIMLYNVPSRTGLRIEAKTAGRLQREFDNINSIKEASGDISHIIDLMHETQGDMDLYSGNDDQIIPLLSLGAKGVVSVVANMIPTETHDIVSLYMDGKRKEALDLNLKLLSFIRAAFCDVNPIPIKEAMNLAGMQVGRCRLPLVETSLENKEKLKKEMKKLNLL